MKAKTAMEAAADIKKDVVNQIQQDVEIEESAPMPQKEIRNEAQPEPKQQPIGKICYGDCFACSIQQAIYCASTHARVAMRIVEQISRQYDEVCEALGTLTNEVIDMKKQVTIPDDLINPLDAQA